MRRERYVNADSLSAGSKIDRNGPQLRIKITKRSPFDWLAPKHLRSDDWPNVSGFARQLGLRACAPAVIATRCCEKRENHSRRRRGIANKHKDEAKLELSMSFFKVIVASCFLVTGANASFAASCSDTGGQYEAWKPEMAAEAKANGVGERGIAALMGTSYSKATIAADRNQKSFKYTLEKFLSVRGADTIVKQGKARKAKNAALFAGIEKNYGVPAGVIIAIHGMETGFGGFMGDTNVISAIATLSYDCRRSGFFTPHLIGALKLVDRGSISAKSVGAKHGELGHTQFLPGNALTYGVDGNGDGRVDLNNVTDALASTANFLRQKGWRPGAGYQEGEPNFAVIKQWNAAKVYQQAIAIMGKRIDG